MPDPIAKKVSEFDPYIGDLKNLFLHGYQIIAGNKKSIKASIIDAALESGKLIYIQDGKFKSSTLPADLNVAELLDLNHITVGNIPMRSEDGVLEDTGIAAEDVATKQNLADIVVNKTNYPNGNIATQALATGTYIHYPNGHIAAEAIAQGFFINFPSAADAISIYENVAGDKSISLLNNQICLTGTGNVFQSPEGYEVIRAESGASKFMYEPSAGTQIAIEANANGLYINDPVGNGIIEIGNGGNYFRNNNAGDFIGAEDDYLWICDEFGSTVLSVGIDYATGLSGLNINNNSYTIINSSPTQFHLGDGFTGTDIIFLNDTSFSLQGAYGDSILTAYSDHSGPNSNLTLTRVGLADILSSSTENNQFFSPAGHEGITITNDEVTINNNGFNDGLRITNLSISDEISLETQYGSCVYLFNNRDDNSQSFNKILTPEGGDCLNVYNDRFALVHDSTDIILGINDGLYINNMNGVGAFSAEEHATKLQIYGSDAFVCGTDAFGYMGVSVYNPYQISGMPVLQIDGASGVFKINDANSLQNVMTVDPNAGVSVYYELLANNGFVSSKEFNLVQLSDTYKNKSLTIDSLGNSIWKTPAEFKAWLGL